MMAQELSGAKRLFDFIVSDETESDRHTKLMCQKFANAYNLLEKFVLPIFDLRVNELLLRASIPPGLPPSYPSPPVHRTQHFLPLRCENAFICYRLLPTCSLCHLLLPDCWAAFTLGDIRALIETSVVAVSQNTTSLARITFDPQFRSAPRVGGLLDIGAVSSQITFGTAPRWHIVHHSLCSRPRLPFTTANMAHRTI